MRFSLKKLSVAVKKLVVSWRFWSNKPISERIFYSFLMGLACSLLLTIINIWNIKSAPNCKIHCYFVWSLLLLNILIIILIILPSLKELQAIVKPLNKAAKVSLDGALSVTCHATRIDESIEQLQTVLTIITTNIADIYQDNEYSSFQAKNAIASLKQLFATIDSLAIKATPAEQKQINQKTKEAWDSIDKITIHIEEVSAEMQELAASTQDLNEQMEWLSQRVNETNQLLQKELQLAQLVKDSIERF